MPRKSSLGGSLDNKLRQRLKDKLRAKPIDNAAEVQKQAEMEMQRENNARALKQRLQEENLKAMLDPSGNRGYFFKPAETPQDKQLKVIKAMEDRIVQTLVDISNSEHIAKKIKSAEDAIVDELKRVNYIKSTVGTDGSFYPKISPTGKPGSDSSSSDDDDLDSPKSADTEDLIREYIKDTSKAPPKELIDRATTAHTRHVLQSATTQQQKSQAKKDVLQEFMNRLNDEHGLVDVEDLTDGELVDAYRALDGKDQTLKDAKGRHLHTQPSHVIASQRDKIRAILDRKQAEGSWTGKLKSAASTVGSVVGAVGSTIGKAARAVDSGIGATARKMVEMKKEYDYLKAMEATNKEALAALEARRSATARPVVGRPPALTGESVAPASYTPPSPSRMTWEEKLAEFKALNPDMYADGGQRLSTLKDSTIKNNPRYRKMAEDAIRDNRKGAVQVEPLRGQDYYGKTSMELRSRR